MSSRALLAAALAWAGLAGCGRRTDPALEQDLARMDRALALGPEAAPQVLQEIGAIGDPVVREAAVDGWLDRWQRQVPPPVARSMCGLLEEPGRQACERKQTSPHLQGPPP